MYLKIVEVDLWSYEGVTEEVRSSTQQETTSLSVFPFSNKVEYFISTKRLSDLIHLPSSPKIFAP
jgi:hypothetical protein